MVLVHSPARSGLDSGCVTPYPVGSAPGPAFGGPLFSAAPLLLRRGRPACPHRRPVLRLCP
jgi:hypothetical protein